jgi:hypothetical protein
MFHPITYSSDVHDRARDLRAGQSRGAGTGAPAGTAGGVEGPLSPASPGGMSPSRTLKIEREGDRWRGGFKPKIRIMGRWLERAGFPPEARVQVVHTAPGVIELRVLATGEARTLEAAA